MSTKSFTSCPAADGIAIIKRGRSCQITTGPMATTKRCASCPPTHVAPASAPRLTLITNAFGPKLVPSLVPAALPPTTLPRTPKLSSSAPRSIYANDHFSVQWISAAKGLGCIAVRDIKAGDDILFERGMLFSYFVGREVPRDADILAAEERLGGEEKRVLRALSKSDRWGMMHAAVALLRTNSFKIPNGMAIFPIAARFNHACRPVANIAYRYDARSGLLVFTASRAIRAGEELTISYTLNPLLLPSHWGFVCECGGDCRPHINAMRAYRPPDEW